MKTVVDEEYVTRINGPNVEVEGSKMDQVEMLMDDIRNFRTSTGAARMVMIWCGSTEVFHRAGAVHQTLQDFECGLQKDDPDIVPARFRGGQQDWQPYRLVGKVIVAGMSAGLATSFFAPPV